MPQAFHVTDIIQVEDIEMLRSGECTPQELLLDMVDCSLGDCQYYVTEAMRIAHEEFSS